MQLIQLPA